MAIIRQLKNFFTKQVIYPKTLTKAVYDENGERLDKILRDTMLAVDSEEYNGVEPRDADTLGGKYTAKDIGSIEDNLTNINSNLSDINNNLSELLNCKNEEQIIGTLFGKTLYRRVLYIEKEDKSAITGQGSFDLTSLFGFNLGDVDILKNMYMCGYKRGIQAYMLGNSNNNSNNNYSNMAAIWINPSGHSMLNYTFGEYFISTNYIVITLEYTKL